jgi:hypothetical protein
MSVTDVGHECEEHRRIIREIRRRLNVAEGASVLGAFRKTMDRIDHLRDLHEYLGEELARPQRFLWWTLPRRMDRSYAEWLLEEIGKL